MDQVRSAPRSSASFGHAPLPRAKTLPQDSGASTIEQLLLMRSSHNYLEQEQHCAMALHSLDGKGFLAAVGALAKLVPHLDLAGQSTAGVFLTTAVTMPNFPATADFSELVNALEASIEKVSVHLIMYCILQFPDMDTASDSEVDAYSNLAQAIHHIRSAIRRDSVNHSHMLLTGSHAAWKLHDG